MKLVCDNCNSAQNGFFCELDNLLLSEVNQNRIEKKYKKGQFILIEGHIAPGLFCVKKGKIKIIKKFNDGREAIIHISRVGDLIGHSSIFFNQIYTSSAVAMEESHLCFIDREFILDLIKKHPSLALNLMKKFSEELITAETRFSSIIQRNVRERIADLLLNLSKDFGIREENRIKLDIKLTRDEMASMIGSVNETVIRCMTEFRDEELIEEEGKTIYIINEKRLMEFANYKNFLR